MSFGWSKTEKQRRARKIRSDMTQYINMQREDIRAIFPDWLEKQGEALLSAQATLTSMLNEHSREVQRHESQRLRQEEGQ